MSGLRTGKTETKAGNAAVNAERQDAAIAVVRRLLSFLACGNGVRSAPAEGGRVTLARPDGTSRKFDRGVLAVAIRAGLVCEDRKTRELVLAGPGRQWLKRAAAARAEDGFGAQHRTLERRTIETCEGAAASHTSVDVNLAESPLLMIARLKDRDGGFFLAPEAVAAGERLRRDFTRAGIQPRISANWEASVARGGRQAGGAADIGDMALDARRRVERALAAVGPELSGVVLDVCCFLKGLETVERERRWPARSAKLMLRAGLLALDRHYEGGRQEGRRRAGDRHAQGERSHRWGADDYRPAAGDLWQGIG